MTNPQSIAEIKFTIHCPAAEKPPEPLVVMHNDTVLSPGMSVADGCVYLGCDVDPISGMAIPYISAPNYPFLINREAVSKRIEIDGVHWKLPLNKLAIRFFAVTNIRSPEHPHHPSKMDRPFVWACDYEIEDRDCDYEIEDRDRDHSKIWMLNTMTGDIFIDDKVNEGLLIPVRPVPTTWIRCPERSGR